MANRTSKEEFIRAVFGHAAFQFLNAACELRLFEYLGQSPCVDKRDIIACLDIPAPSVDCLLVALTALGLIRKDGARYANTLFVRESLMAGTWPAFVDLVRFEARFAYLGEIDLVESLRTGVNVGLGRIQGGTGTDLYRRLESAPELREDFFRYMASWTAPAVAAMLHRVNLANVNYAVDVGGGDATAAIMIATAYPKLTIDLIELPENAPVPIANVAAAGLHDRVRIVAADFFKSEFPPGMDCVFFIHQLVIWPIDIVAGLLRRAYRGLHGGGMVVILNSVMNDSEDGPYAAAMDNAYFATVPSCGGMIRSWSHYESALQTAGFSAIRRVPLGLWTPQGVIVATK